MASKRCFQLKLYPKLEKSAFSKATVMPAPSSLMCKLDKPDAYKRISLICSLGCQKILVMWCAACAHVAKPPPHAYARARKDRRQWYIRKPPTGATTEAVATIGGDGSGTRAGDGSQRRGDIDVVLLLCGLMEVMRWCCGAAVVEEMAEGKTRRSQINDARIARSEQCIKKPILRMLSRSEQCIKKPILRMLSCWLCVIYWWSRCWQSSTSTRIRRKIRCISKASSQHYLPVVFLCLQNLPLTPLFKGWGDGRRPNNPYETKLFLL